MYTEADFESAAKESGKRLFLIILLAAAFLALMIVFDILRIQPLAMASAAVGFCVCYFLSNFKVAPWVRYNRFMRELKTGTRKTQTSEFVMVSGETRLHDGVEVYEFITRVGPEEKDERLFYWDADKKLPDFKEGDMLEIVSFANFVTDIKAL